MKVTDKPIGKSLKFKLIFGFVVTTLPLILLLVGNNQYAIHVVRNQVALSNRTITNIGMAQMDRNLLDIDQYLYDVAAEETDLLSLELPADHYSQDYYAAKIRMVKKLSEDIGKYKFLDTLFVYSITNDDLLTTMIRGSSYSERERIRNTIWSIFRDPSHSSNYRYNQWFVLPTDGGYSLYHIVKAGNVVIGAWMNPATLLKTLDDRAYEGSQRGKGLLVTANGEPMTDRAFLEGKGIDLQYIPDTFKLTGEKKQYLLVGSKSGDGNFSLVRLVEEDSILEGLPYMQWVVSLISCGAIGVLLIYLIYMRKVIFSPLERLVHAMRRIKDGQLDSRIPVDTSTHEFGLVHETFNSMMGDMHHLKISIYEEQIRNQQAELKHLQLQINPHFFLNSLNIIFHLAQVRNFALIQEMSRCLVHYFRFMFRSNLDFVALKDEMEHTGNYLRIQELRFPDNLTYDLQVSDQLLHMKVPPLVIQTFVENAIKHAVTLNESVHIQVDVFPEVVGSQEGIGILVHDTGSGFPDQVLSMLQSGQPLTDEQGEHIGIWNVERRLRLLYSQPVAIQYRNDTDSGAVVHIRLPIVS